MMSYEEQLKFKQRKVYNNLKRIGGLDNLYLPGRDLGQEKMLGMEKEIEQEIEKEERERKKACHHGADNRDGGSVALPE